MNANDATMRVTVRLFAILREGAGSDRLELELAPGATVEDALRVLAERPPVEELLARLPVHMAVNREYADRQTVLHAADEIALIPPLSGGEPQADAAVHVRICEQSLDIARVRERVSHDGAGAVVTFEGVTREVERLDYEAYTAMAEQRIGQIMHDCARRHSLRAAAVEHRVGSVALGEPSVVVCVSAAHRREAFAGAREAIDRIKAEAPIWKREVLRDGTARWVQGMPAPGAAATLTHLDSHGSARMVDVGDKPPSERVARARARVRMSRHSAQAVQSGNGPKGEVLGVARIAGIQAAKLTGQLIPLAHPLALSFVDVQARVDVSAGLVELIGEARTFARTGVEMEAMTACSVAALAVYDMVKGLERTVALEQVVLLEKRGGRSDYRREED
ncbi:MAG TPA: cyclic pyranopterin monophosphate synthase MoaC [Solirubrobacteraceae bacterium]|nr:cyclic pyranopterin monophosphate synthase MoaC [Solirubrobacteraceae bacterium]